MDSGEIAYVRTHKLKIWIATAELSYFIRIALSIYIYMYVRTSCISICVSMRVCSCVKFNVLVQMREHLRSTQQPKSARIYNVTKLKTKKPVYPYVYLYEGHIDETCTKQEEVRS